MSKPHVSVVIPTYNRPALLAEALDSVGQQSFQDYEVIVVDDGSDEPIAKKIADHATRPRVIRQRRQGPAAARNRGLREARAEIVAFLDSDDLWLPPKLERFVRALQEHEDIRIFYGPMQPINACGEAVPGRTKPCYAGWITQLLFCSSFVHVPTVVCRKEVLLTAGGFDESLSVCEDYDLWLRLSVHEPFGLIEEPLAKRRLHDDRLSKQSMSSNLAVKARVLRSFHQSGKSNGRLNERIAAERLARVCFVAGRAAFRVGRYRQAADWCRASRSYGRLAVRTLPLSLAAGALSILAGGDNGLTAESPPKPDQPKLVRHDAT